MIALRTIRSAYPAITYFLLCSNLITNDIYFDTQIVLRSIFIIIFLELLQ
jgi:hypothetical protein